MMGLGWVILDLGNWAITGVVPAEPTMILLLVFEILIVSSSTTTVSRAPTLPVALTVPIPVDMLSLVVPAEIPFDFTNALTEENRKWKRAKGRTLSIVQPLQQFQQAQGSRDQYVSRLEQRITLRSTKLIGQMRCMTCCKCGQEGHIVSCGPQLVGRFSMPPKAGLILSSLQILQTSDDNDRDASRQRQTLTAVTE
ncbi:hypothetical protein Scep_007559 [Stephania cephalantha]|uniref:Uncharacterized protein n=1 Tax=Stephania cephalantha TaxID=152367 RepID=A0AAP0KCT8_9MAGN